MSLFKSLSLSLTLSTHSLKDSPRDLNLSLFKSLSLLISLISVSTFVFVFYLLSVGLLKGFELMVCVQIPLQGPQILFQVLACGDHLGGYDDSKYLEYQFKISLTISIHLGDHDDSKNHF